MLFELAISPHIGTQVQPNLEGPTLVLLLPQGRNSDTFRRRGKRKAKRKLTFHTLDPESKYDDRVIAQTLLWFTETL